MKKRSVFRRLWVIPLAEELAGGAPKLETKLPAGV